MLSRVKWIKIRPAVGIRRLDFITVKPYVERQRNLLLDLFDCETPNTTLSLSSVTFKPVGKFLTVAVSAPGL